MRRLLGPILLALVCTLLATACSAEVGSPVRVTQPQPRSPSALLLEFDSSAAAPGNMLASAKNLGTADVRIVVVTVAGGRITRDRSRTGFGIRLPAVTPDPPSPAAAMVLWPAGEDSSLSPEGADFRFGADFRLDAVSEDSVDNGDNLMQRGLFSSDAQFKLQLDHGRVSCRVAGTRGAVFVVADPPIERNIWYRVTCQRVADQVRLTVASAEGSAGWAPERVSAGTGQIGKVQIADEVPMSIGAKVSDIGQIVSSAPDQFNGSIDRVFFEQVP